MAIVSTSNPLHDADYARSLGIDVADARNYGVDYNPNWGRSPFSSYQEYYNGSVHDARDSEIIMERENFYHKPQANLNWYWTPNAQFMLSNVFYFSRGKGGGTGRLGSNPGALPDGTINWQRVADELNTQPASEANSDLVDAGEVGADEIAAATIIRNSVNQHFWYGYLGTAEYHLSDIYKLTFGADFYRQRKLLLHQVDRPLVAQEHLQRGTRTELPIFAKRH